jgi:hypothetical protein
MYSAALKKCQQNARDSKLEATAICNYASFLAKYKNDITKADAMFRDGLERL